MPFYEKRKGEEKKKRFTAKQFPILIVKLSKAFYASVYEKLGLCIPLVEKSLVKVTRIRVWIIAKKIQYSLYVYADIWYFINGWKYLFHINYYIIYMCSMYFSRGLKNAFFLLSICVWVWVGFCVCMEDRLKVWYIINWG